MKRLVCIATGHRVLTRVRRLFYDPIGQSPVSLFECAHGTRYMADDLFLISRFGFKTEHHS